MPLVRVSAEAAAVMGQLLAAPGGSLPFASCDPLAGPFPLPGPGTATLQDREAAVGELVGLALVDRVTDASSDVVTVTAAGEAAQLQRWGSRTLNTRAAA